MAPDLPAPDLRREMKRCFAAGEYRRALSLAEQILRTNPDDAIAEAIYLESRSELDAAPISSEPESINIEITTDPEPETLSADSAPHHAGRTPALTMLEPEELVQARASAWPPPSAPNRELPPTTPPGLSEEVPPVRRSAPTLQSDEANEAVDEFSADATVAIRGLSWPVDAPSDEPEHDDPGVLARTMYDHFVEHRYEQAIELAEQILALRPRERLAVALLSQSKTALARMTAIVILVPPPADLGQQSFSPHQQAVLAWIDGSRNVSEIAEACKLPITEVLRVLDDLRERQIVVLGDVDAS